MFLSLRASIFWNLLILMILASALICFVVFKIMEREILKQRILGAEQVFYSINASFTQILTKEPYLLKAFATKSKLQELAHLLTVKPLIKQIALVDNNQIVLAHSEENRIGQPLADDDLMQAMHSKNIFSKVKTTKPDLQQSLSVSGPLGLQKNNAALLKIVLPLQDVQQDIVKSQKVILLYLVFDTLILILIGTFLLSRYLVKPIDKLIKLTANISGENSNLPLHHSDRNEIGKLSASLGSMFEKLKEEKKKVQEHIQALEEKNKQLQQAQQEIIQSEKLASVGRLAAGIAHEIGNPIGIILGYLHMIQTQELEDGERADYLERMEAETERISSIIRDLLDYAQPASQTKEAQNLNSIIEDSYSLISHQKDFQNNQAIFNLSPDLPPLYAHDQQLRQIIINLVLNALDAMPNGGTLTFQTSLQNIASAEYICLTVADTGAGISFEDQKKIFDPFFSTKEAGKGTGLGLSNVHRIVDDLGGKISISSSPGSGTTFTIMFPVIKEIQ